MNWQQCTTCGYVWTPRANQKQCPSCQCKYKFIEAMVNHLNEVRDQRREQQKMGGNKVAEEKTNYDNSDFLELTGV